MAPANSISDQIAIIGMAGRFPGAANVHEYWENLRGGIESIRFFTDAELREAGIGDAELKSSDYVPARGVLDGVELFDADFFGINPREAASMDPQHRLFLECAWETFEDAGYDSARLDVPAGVFAATGINSYLFQILSSSGSIGDLGAMTLLFGNDKDFIATRVSYKLDLRGPSFAVQSACSSSLVAVHLACQSLLVGECDMALAGGVSIAVPYRVGYWYDKGGISSPDGHCRPFDGRARGSVRGDGLGVVLLKRLAEAVADRDHIYAVIRGTAVGNDGAARIGFSAPGIAGQSRVIAEALAVAGVAPATIAYVEGHGSGTELGDRIEIAALKQAFGEVSKRECCWIGSVKSNIGHLDAAAGMAGLIKAVLAMQHGEVPPTLHFEQANEQSGLAGSPFHVNTTLQPWISNGPRRAGVSSFGMGGTNVHIVIEQAQEEKRSNSSRPWQLLVWSARTESALGSVRRRLADHLRTHDDEELADVAYTLQVGRRRFAHRQLLVCRNREGAVQGLEQEREAGLLTWRQDRVAGPLAMVFGGLGEQTARLGQGLYASEPAFRNELDSCAEGLLPLLGIDIRKHLFGGAAPNVEPRSRALDLRQLVGQQAETLEETWIAQPAVFALEYSLARMWMEWGVKPDAVLGYSLGEYVAACIAGVISIEDALRVVVERARLIAAMPAGAMIAVLLGESEVRKYWRRGLWLAAVNGPDQTVVAGEIHAVEELRNTLEDAGVAARRLPVRHAFHSGMMKDATLALKQAMSEVKLRSPEIRYLSNLTGGWVSGKELADPEYWGQHLMNTVKFGEGMAELCREPGRILLEVGSGQTVASAGHGHPGEEGEFFPTIVSTLPQPWQERDEQAHLLESIGRLWLAGAEIDWSRFYRLECRRRRPLPSYPFERQRYWIESGDTIAKHRMPPRISKRSETRQWLYTPSWKREVPLPDWRAHQQQGHWLIFADQQGWGQQVSEVLGTSGVPFSLVRSGSECEQFGSDFKIRPDVEDDYEYVFRELKESGRAPRRILHLWSVDEPDIDRSFYSLVNMAKALGRHTADDLMILVVTTKAASVTGTEELSPTKWLTVGPCRVIPQEYANITCRSLDLVEDEWSGTSSAERLLSEAVAERGPVAVAYRGRHRWSQTYESLDADEGSVAPSVWRDHGAYFITGGLGQIGLSLSEHLASKLHARLALTTRRLFPPREEWERLGASEDTEPELKHFLGRLLAIEGAGAEILVVTAEAQDLAQMQHAFRVAQQRFGALDGVIHAAGLPGEAGSGSGQSISESTRAAYDRQFLAKVHGIEVLKTLLANHRVDFCLLLSSLATVLGGLGFCGYAAANAYMDGFAQRERQDGHERWISVDFDTWAIETTEQQIPPAAHMEQLRMTPAEGFGVLSSVLNLMHCPQVVVSIGDLQIRLRDWTRMSRPTVEPKRNSPGHRRPDLATPYSAPRTETERKVAAVWQELLGFDALGVHDSFFDLGGHSLMAMQVVSRLRKLFATELPLKGLFVRPTIAGVAEAIEKQPLGPRPSFPLLEKSTSIGELPTSCVQERMWFQQQLASNSAVYNMPLLLHMDGVLNASALDRGVQELVKRQAVLRTYIAEREGRLVQVVLPELSVSVSKVDLSLLPAGERAAEARRLIAEEGARPFNLALAPIMRVSLLRLSEHEHVLLLTMHHIVSDGWSLGVLVREVAELYDAFVAGRQPRLPKLEIEYADYAVWQRKWLQGEMAIEQLEYWSHQLTGLPTLSLPTDGNRIAGSGSPGKTLHFDLDRQIVAKLKQVSARENVTPFMLLLAVYHVLLGRYAGQEDVPVGSPIVNRRHLELESLVGCLLNTVVMRGRLHGNPSFRELLARTRETVLEATAHGELPFEKVVEKVAPSRTLTGHPLFQVWFVLLDFPNSATLDLPGLTIRTSAVDTGTAPFDLSLSLMPAADGLTGYLNYDTDLFSSATAGLLAVDYQRLLNAFLQDINLKIAGPAIGLATQAGAAECYTEAAEEFQF